MRTTMDWVSRVVFLAIGALCFQLASAAPPDLSGPGERVITKDGILKLKGELSPDDTVISVIPQTSADSGTLTVGFTFSACGDQVNSTAGFASGAYGSYSPTGLTGGHSVADLWDIGGPCIEESSFSASGFSADPGSSWLSSVTCNGVTNTGATGTFSYFNGVATWTWKGLSHLFGFRSLVRSNVSCSVVHS